MKSNVASISDSYFTIRRFEQSLSYRPFRAEKILSRRKKVRLFDRIALTLTATILSLILYVAGNILYFNVSTIISSRKIDNLCSELIKLNDLYNNKMEVINKDLRNLNIKQIAFFDLNMIIPTEKNIIYFDKTETP